MKKLIAIGFFLIILLLSLCGKQETKEELAKRKADEIKKNTGIISNENYHIGCFTKEDLSKVEEARGHGLEAFEYVFRNSSCYVLNVFSGKKFFIIERVSFEIRKIVITGRENGDIELYVPYEAIRDN